MKADIHPKYFDKVEIRCSCGNVITAGSTRENLKTELCSKCHPFYTGQQKLVDTAGRVDKFQAKRKKFEQIQEAATKRAEAKKKKPEVYEEKVIPAEILEKSISAGKPKGKWAAPVGDAPAEEVLKEEIAKVKTEKAKKVVVKKVAPKKPVAAKKPAAKKSVKK